jgi:hypothetical protein
MIYRMATDLEGRLHARKFPLRVYYGPERLTREMGRSLVILIRRDREQGDTARAVVGANRNPRAVGVRDLGVIADVYAAANVAGARANEHEHLCDAVVDALLCALYEWGTASGAGAIPVTESRFLTDAEREGEEVCPGMVYRLRFRVPRAIKVRDYEGNALPESAPSGLSTHTRVTADGSNFEDV